MESTWLKDLVFSTDLLEPDAVLSLRELMFKIPFTEEQQGSLSKVFISLEEKRISKEAFLDDLVSKLGYVPVGRIILDLYYMMDWKRNIFRHPASLRTIHSYSGFPPLPSHKEQSL